MLNTEELVRYSRHFSLSEVGVAGQEKLKSARVLCIGAGGLGSPLLLYLAAAGIGTIGIIDDDFVDLSNLQRQVLYSTQDVKKKKVDIAKAKLAELNPHINIITYPERLHKKNALGIIQNYDVIADGTDNFPTRYLVNDACFHTQKPHVYASIFQFEGQCSIFNANRNAPCYRCLYDSPPPAGLIPNCAEGGVLGVLPGIIGTIQAIEVIKLILNIGNPLIGRLLTVDALSMRFQEFEVKQHPDCRLCAHHQAFETLSDYSLISCATAIDNIDEISVNALHQLLRYKKEELILLDVREPHEYAICNLGGMLIPLRELNNKLFELDKKQSYVIHCKSGERSRKAVKLLQEAGFTSVKNLSGGISAWAREIDKNMPVY